MREAANISFGVLKFTYESQQQARQVIEKFKQKVKFDEYITRGLYYRGVE